MVGPDFSLAGRTALLTGAARGIGLAIAEALASVGCAVGIQDIDEAEAQRAAERLSRAGARAAAFGGDVADPGLPPRLIERAAALGPIDILVNNAAIQHDRHWLEVDDALLRREFEADLLCAIRLCQGVVPSMRRRGFGRILNVGSVQGRRGNPRMLGYSLCKAALQALSSALARDLASSGITVNCIGPGWFNTLRNAGDFPTAESVREQGRHVPAGRVGEPRDCAGAALLLCGPAGAYITGQTLYIDGGITA